MSRWMWTLFIWWMALPSWARLGGGSSYRSSSRSYSSSSYRSSSSSSSSWGGSSSSSSWGGSSSGSSYSGGSYSGGGGGGDGLAFMVLFFVLVALVVMAFFHFNSSERPSRKGLGCGGFALLGVGAIIVMSNPVLMLLGFVVFRKHLSQILQFFGLSFGGDRGERDFRSYNPLDDASMSYRPEIKVDPADIIRGKDPNFSTPIFREFAVLLYSQAIQEMPNGKFVHSRPYLAPNVVKQLEMRGSRIEGVQDVVVGMVKLGTARVGIPNLTLKVELESNYLVRREDRTQAFVALETWTFERKIGLLTQPPKTISKLTCPSCGYGGDFPASGVCPQCQKTNVRGDFDWVVTSVEVLELNEFKPHLAEGGGVEEGTNLPTVYSPDLPRMREEFLTRHPSFSFQEFWVKASTIFLKLQQGWSQRDASQCRPHETDVLFRTHRYWIDDYLRSGKINKLSDIRVQDWELSKIELDAYYESITARVSASMIDVTTDESGKVLYGDPSKRRTFTEYWTFIRRIGGKEAKGDSVHSCPSCGAPLDRINQAGECEYCQTVITLGDFDWVLSNIEQDEVYEP